MTDSSPERDELARYVPHVIAAVLLAGAVPIGLTRGGPAVVLWFAFGLLAGTVLLFWETLRAVVDTTAAGDAPDTDEDNIPAEQRTRKRAALQALRDIEFERSIGRLSDEDYKALEKKYRDEARAAMRAIDDGLGPWLERADAELKKLEHPEEKAATAATAAAPSVSAERAPVCAKCATTNDGDAVFCKKCGTRVVPEAAEASDAS